MNYYKKENYNVIKFNNKRNLISNVCTKNSKIQKILFIVVIVFIAMLVSGFEKSLGTDTYTCDETIEKSVNGETVQYVITWEYELINDNAENIRIQQVTRDGYQIIPSEITEGGKFDIDTGELGTLTIPSTLDGHTVVSIGDGQNRIINPDPVGLDYRLEEKSIKGLIIPSTVTHINDHAFDNCIKIESVDFGTSVQRIGDYAFRNTVHLGIYNHILTIPDSVTEIGKGAFEINANYCDYSIDETTKELRAYPKDWGLFRWWDMISFLGFDTISFGKNVTTIGDFAFAGNKRISEITIPSNITTIGRGAFGDCSNVTSITFEDRTQILQVQDFAFSGLDNKLESITIPNTVNLGEATFKKNSNLKTVIIEDGITSIPDSTFSECESLINVTIPSTVTSIEESAFEGCTSLSNMTIPNTITSIGSRAFANCLSLTIELYNEIVKNATEIGKYAFANCDNLTGDITIKDIVNNLGDGVFYDCDGLTSATINANITKLPNELFYSCDNLEDVTKNSKIVTIGESCFESCKSINLDVLHNKILTNIATIGISAFENCTGLSGELIIPTNIQNIEDEAFYNCNNITNIVFNEGIKSIGYEAFWGVSEIPETINLPSSLTNISTRAFYQIREAFFNNTEKSIELQNRWYGRRNVIVHFSDCKHTIDVTCNLPGVKIVNTATGEELTSGDYDCESSVTFKVIVEDGYTYPELCVKLVSEGQYADSELVKEFVELNENNEYSINNLTRAKKIIVQKNKSDTDLVLRQFITRINNRSVSETRIPSISAIETKSIIEPVEYNHTKYPVSVEKDDTITYGIRVYNEGDANGKVKQIKVYLENGLELVQNNETNQFYQWNIQETLEQGTVLTSNYLDGKEIELYTGYGKPEYQELELVCKVTKEEAKRLVSVAELSDSTDADSVGGNFDINMLQDYKKDESYTSTSDSYIKSDEDDTDFESVELKQVVRVGYAIVLQKTDSTNLELLNGAKFNLYDKDKNLIESRVTVNDGKLEFSELITFGEGTDTYYIEEVETPAGYKRTINGMIELTVEKTIDENGNVSLKIYCDVNENILDISDDEKIADIDDSDFEIEGFSDKGFDVQFDGYETEENYIPIYTVEQLKKINATTSGNVTIEGKEYFFRPGCYYKLMNDIVLEEAWEPFDFKGTLDGNNFTIANMRIDNDCSFINEGVSSKSQLGFFGDVQGVIKNLNFANATINVQKITSGGRVGIICSSMRGTIENCHVNNSTITADNVENVGGLVGVAYDKLNIKNSGFNYNIVGSSNVGGLVGSNQANLYITGSSVTGAKIQANAIVGGIIGNNYANAIITNNTVNINNIQAIYIQAGGIIGTTNRGILNIYKNNITGSITTGQSMCGGIIGLASSNVDINECNINCTITAQESDAGGIIGNLSSGKLRIQNVKTYNVVTVTQCNAGGFIGQTSETDAGSDILIKDCENNGNVTGNQYNIGGYIGISHSVVEIINSKNTAAIISNEQSNVGGFIGQSLEKARILNSSNSGHIQAKVSNAGGLVGISGAPIIISNSENSEEVIGLNNIGGLIGSTTNECKIYNNSKNTGNISTTTSGSADGSNIGGFIGNALGVTRIEDCTNEGNVVAYDNAGGLVGYAKSSLDIFGCTNKGNIESKRYISGGLVGVAEPSGYTPNNIIVAYDEVDKAINIAIKNKEVVNNYNLVLEKIDISNNVYIDGALFNIYDKDMNLLKENVEVVNGKIEVLNTTINSLNTDVFYIKEVQAPKGYDIQVNDYVRVEVNKTWNSDKEKYEININPTIETEKVDGEYKEDTTKTGTKSDLTQSEYVVWKTDKVKIANSTNEGTVTSGTIRTEKDSYGRAIPIYGTSGGIAGLIMGNADIQECKNTGIINVVYGHMGGIVGFLAGYEEDMTSKIFLCSNGDENNPEARTLISSEAVQSGDGVGGIVGTSVSDTVITECYNYSNIYVANRIGGIIGLSSNNLYIEDCHNLADLISSSKGSPVGGLIGTQFGNPSSWGINIEILNKYKYEFDNSVNLNVINSSFEGDIHSSGNTYSQTGGIIGNIISHEGNTVYVADCKVGGKDSENKTMITSSAAIGGIIGTGYSEELELNNNTISNIIMNTSEGSGANKVGGLVGEYTTTIKQGMHIYKVDINNNVIENAVLHTCDGDTGGVFGKLCNYDYGSSSSMNTMTAESDVYINNCNIINSIMIREYNDDGFAGVGIGGLIGNTYGNIGLEIEKCNIIDTDLVNGFGNAEEDTSSDIQIGGLIGWANIYSANIHDCEVKSTKEEKNTIKLLTTDDNTSPIGGLVGMFYFTNQIDIQNCKIYNMDFITTCASQFGGVIGGVVRACKELNIDNVQLEKIALIESDFMENRDDMMSASQAGFIGGILDCDNIVIRNSSLKDSELNIDGYCVGGIIGRNSSENTIIDSIAMENVQIHKNENQCAASSCGGIIAYQYGNLQINKSILKDINIFINWKQGCKINGLATQSIRRFSWLYRKRVVLE